MTRSPMYRYVVALSICVLVGVVVVVIRALVLTRTAETRPIKTVFMIVMENTNWSSIVGHASEAPYLNSLLTGANNSQTAYATQYYNPPNNHPSLQNYLWLEGGQCYTYCGTNDPPPKLSPNGIGAQHLTTLLDHAGVSWTSYSENYTDGVCPLTAPGFAMDPFVYFNDVNGSLSYCTSHLRNYNDLATDLARNAVARYNVIVPNMCDDMHNSCAPTHDAIKQGDTWLANQVPTILRSRAYKDGGALFIAWDEGEGSDGPIGLIVLSAAAKGHGYTSHIQFTHSATLRTLQEIFRVGPLLGAARNAPDLSDLFTTFPPPLRAAVQQG